MAITNLQQARQLYAMGQRVAKTLDGSRPGYGGGADMGANKGYQGGTTSTSSNDKGKGSTTTNNNIGGGGGRDVMPITPVSDTFPNNLGGGITISTDPMDLKEQYRIGNVPTNPFMKGSLNSGIVTFDNPYVSQELEKQRKNNFIDALNLRGATYQPVQLPSYIPGSTLLNIAGDIFGKYGFNKNKDFFQKNVAGKYGYGYSLDDYKQYMKDRTSGKVGAYGNEEMGQNAINQRTGNTDPQGIESIYYNNMFDEDNDNLETNLFTSRFLQNQPDQIRQDIEEQMQNYYTV